MEIDNFKNLLTGTDFTRTDFGSWYALSDRRVAICVGNNNGIYKGRCLFFNRETGQYKSYENELWRFGELIGLEGRFLIECAVKELPIADESIIEYNEKLRIVWEKGRSEFERPWFLHNIVRTFYNPLKNNDMNENLIKFNNEHNNELKKNLDVVTLTPELAREYLANQRENRKPKVANLSKLINDLENDRYVYNGDPIRFDKHGRMGDGQHRCIAVIKTGKQIPVLIVRNLPEEAFPTVDTGASRTAADVFGFENVSNSTVLAAAVRFYLSLCNDNSGIQDDGHGNLQVQPKSTKNAFTNTQLLEEYHKDSATWDTVGSKAKCLSKERGFMTSSNIAGLIYYLIKEKKHSEERVYDFMKQLLGKRDAQYDVINKMRDLLIDRKEHKDRKRYTGKYVLGMLAKTWNYYLSGKEVRQLKYNADVEGKINFL